MPRRYTLGRRATKVLETRQRIVDAAAGLYQDRGVSGTTMQEVARRADVAPGTVLNHFASPDDLARAVVQQVVGSLRLPAADVFAGLDSVPDRVAQLVHELFAFYDRSQAWYLVYAREPNGVPAWADAEAAFHAEFERLIRDALGPLGQDDAAVAIVSTVLDGGVYSTLRARGLSSSDTAALIVEVLTPWLERKVAFP
jgi:AcrR family transcriptional regulator